MTTAKPPDITIALADEPVGRTSTQKRIVKSMARSEKRLLELLSTQVSWPGEGAVDETGLTSWTACVRYLCSSCRQCGARCAFRICSGTASSAANAVRPLDR